MDAEKSFGFNNNNCNNKLLVTRNWNFPNLIKNIYHKLTENIILNLKLQKNTIEVRKKAKKVPIATPI